ncbi:hydrolase [Bacillus paramycoides]|uniref:hydrolase n=1 Tax=Bacillus paramycoides TaxID=2026194 RepID=UPI002E231FFA|nr:hydrolase [Bacillus paramycoides]
MDNVLNGKVVTLGLIPIDKKAYKKAGIDVNRFKYYKLYGQKPMFYSVEYLMQTPIKYLLERDKEKKDCLVKTNERI